MYVLNPIPNSRDKKCGEIANARPAFAFSSFNPN